MPVFLAGCCASLSVDDLPTDILSLRCHRVWPQVSFYEWVQNLQNFRYTTFHTCRCYP